MLGGEVAAKTKSLCSERREKVETEKEFPLGKAVIQIAPRFPTPHQNPKFCFFFSVLFNFLLVSSLKGQNPTKKCGASGSIKDRSAAKMWPKRTPWACTWKISSKVQG